MQIDSYKTAFNDWFSDESIRNAIRESVALIASSRRMFFIGNGGSNAICSHMMEDFMKMAGKQCFSFSDPALITCFANDYGYENALEKWIEFNAQEGDVLVAISSSGESKNILNAVDAHRRLGGKVISISGFKKGNSLSAKGDISIHTEMNNYGVVECFHQVILHSILDEIVK